MRDEFLMQSIKTRRKRYDACDELERLMGVEPTYAAWEAAVLPMNYSRVSGGYYSRPLWKLQPEKCRPVMNEPPAS